MEVRKNYKQTEFGIFPEDWETKKLGDVFVLQHGFSFSSLYFSDIGPIVLTPGNFKLEGGLYFTESKTKRYSGEYSKNFEFKKGDLLIVMTDLTPDCNLLGKPAFVDIDEPVLHNQRIGKIILKEKKTSLPYLYYILLSRPYLSRIKETATGSTVRHTSNKSIYSVGIPFPPIPEQHAIAAALSDVDALLNSLDALITKKRLIKQGAMQELLTGKKRLPGFEKKQGYKQTPSGVFPVDWDIVQLKQISSMHGRIGWQGLKQTEFTMNSEQPFLITGMNFKDGDIRWDEVYHVPWDRYEMAKEIQLKTGDVLMTKDGTIGKILFVDEIPCPGKASLNSHLLVFRPLNNKYNPKFLFYQLNSKTFFNHVEQEKSGTTFFGITQEAVGKYNAFLPSVPEQTAIAEILSDMDAEISALEQERKKTRLLKQGMMQELLTGRIRLL